MDAVFDRDNGAAVAEQTSQAAAEEQTSRVAAAHQSLQAAVAEQISHNSGGQIEGYFSVDIELDSPRSLEASERIGVDRSDLIAESNDLLIAQSSAKIHGKGKGELDAVVIRTERDEINRYRLLRQVSDVASPRV